MSLGCCPATSKLPHVPNYMPYVDASEAVTAKSLDLEMFSQCSQATSPNSTFWARVQTHLHVLTGSTLILIWMTSRTRSERILFGHVAYLSSMLIIIPTPLAMRGQNCAL